MSNLGGEAASAALRQQRKALANARAASLAALVQAVLAVFATLVGLAVAPESVLGKVIVLTLAVAPMIVAMRSRGQAKKARSSAAQASERAWQAAAEAVAIQSNHGVTVPALARALGIDAAHADKLLTALTVNDRTRIDVGDDAEVRYSATPGPRVAESDDLPNEHELADDTETAKRERGAP